MKVTILGVKTVVVELAVSIVLGFFMIVFWLLTVKNIINIKHQVVLTIVLLVLQQLTYILMSKG